MYIYKDRVSSFKQLDDNVVISTINAISINEKFGGHATLDTLDYRS